MRPSRGSATGTATDADVGEALLPHGILDHDGNDVPAASAASSQASGGGGTRKSESTKTNAPGRQVAAQLAEERRAPRRGCPRPRRTPRPTGAPARAPARPCVPAAASTALRRRKSSDATSARAAIALVTSAAVASATSARLREPRQRLRVDPHGRPAVADDDDARCLVGRVVADDELVPAGRRGEASAREPVDRPDRIADLVRARPDHVAAVAPPPARQVAERKPDEPPPRHERKRVAFAGGHGLAGGCAVPVGRGRRRELEAALLDLLQRRVARRASASRRRTTRVSSRRWPSTGRNSALDVAGDDVVASLHQRPRARGALERQAAADGRAGRDAFDAPRRAHELDDPAQHQLVDVDVLDRGLQRLDVVCVDARLQRRERMTVALRERRSRPPRRPTDSRAPSAARSGRAAPREAGTCPPARSGSRSR